MGPPFLVQAKMSINNFVDVVSNTNYLTLIHKFLILMSLIHALIIDKQTKIQWRTNLDQNYSIKKFDLLYKNI